MCVCWGGGEQRKTGSTGEGQEKLTFFLTQLHTLKMLFCNHRLIIRKNFKLLDK